ncbi:DUF4838 domain-containing protein [Occultella aeris]|uniref:DUF4838 domain-containing protein n=1 Tax=Occultella aeris TaxID=2761496 RepID=UPI0012E99F60|nr:DUF4838 domain-containing protein [Occultella aeris]
MGTPRALAAEGVALVSDGRAAAVVVLARSRAAQVTAAAQLLVDTVQRATGVVLTVTTEDSISPTESELNRIYVDTRGAWSAQGLDDMISGLDRDGFVLAPGDRSLTVIGNSAWGSQFGAIEMCRRFGAVWLMPDDVGAYVPSATALYAPAQMVQGTPTFRSRALSPLFNAGHTDTLTDPDPLKQWAAHQRMHWRIEFHHNLWRLFPVEKYGDPALPTYRPDFYPIHDGQTYIPPTGTTIQWQPRFSAPGIAAAAAAEILAYLAPRPHLESYSLGVNDSGGFSEDEVDLAKLNSMGYADASEPYYRFVNEVAEIVAAQRPEIKLGLLAYTNVSDPPTFPLHANVVPFLTRDRYGWVDPAIEAEDKRATLAWKALATEVGWYDYRYGAPYAVPRVDSVVVGRAMAWAATAGVTHHYAELYPNWGEGPKPWVLSELTWDPHQDVRALEDRWYDLAVGSAATPAIRSYYRLWESFWRERVPQTTWFRTPRMYYYFADQAYLQVVTEEDIATSRNLLDKAARLAGQPEQAARVEVLRRQFEFYESSARSYPRMVDEPAGTRDALQLIRSIESSLDRNVDLATRRTTLLSEFNASPVMRHSIDLERWYAIGWSGWNVYAIWALASFLKGNQESEMVRRRLATLAGEPGRIGAFARHALAVSDDRIVTRLENAGFESGGLEPWVIDNEWKTADQARVVTEANSTHLRLPAGFQGTIHQEVAASPGVFHLTAQIRAADTAQAGGYYLVAQAQALDADGSMIRQFWSPWAAVADAQAWSAVTVADLLPDATTSVRIALNAQVRAPVMIDTVVLTQLSG